MMLSVNLTRWDIFKAYIQDLYKHFNCNWLILLIAILDIIGCVSVLPVILIDIFSDYDLSIAIDCILALYLMSFLIEKVKKVSVVDIFFNFLMIVLLTLYLPKELDEVMTFSFKCDDKGFKWGDDPFWEWHDVEDIVIAKNYVSIILMRREDNIPIMVIIPKRAFKNTSYDFDHFREFCGNILCQNSESIIQPEV